MGNVWSLDQTGAGTDVRIQATVNRGGRRTATAAAGDRVAACQAAAGQACPSEKICSVLEVDGVPSALLLGAAPSQDYQPLPGGGGCSVTVAAPARGAPSAGMVEVEGEAESTESRLDACLRAKRAACARIGCDPETVRVRRVDGVSITPARSSLLDRFR